RADEDHPRRLACLGEERVLREKAVPWVDRFGTTRLRGPEDLLDRQVRFAGRGWTDRVGFVREPHVKGLAVGLRVDGDGRYPHFAAGADHPHRDLTTISDQELAKHSVRVRLRAGPGDCWGMRSQ